MVGDDGNQKATPLQPEAEAWGTAICYPWLIATPWRVDARGRTMADSAALEPEERQPGRNWAGALFIVDLSLMLVVALSLPMISLLAIEAMSSRFAYEIGVAESSYPKRLDTKPGDTLLLSIPLGFWADAAGSDGLQLILDDGPAPLMATLQSTWSASEGTVDAEIETPGDWPESSSASGRLVGAFVSTEKDVLRVDVPVTLHLHPKDARLSTGRQARSDAFVAAGAAFLCALVLLDILLIIRELINSKVHKGFLRS